MMAMTLGVTPAVAPIFGGWFFSRFGWQSNFLVMAVLGLLLGLCVLLLLVESNQRRDPAATRIRPMLRNFATLARHARYRGFVLRSEENTTELQSLMRISYAVFCLKKKNKKK